jgi:NADH dehydrogenase
VVHREGTRHLVEASEATGVTRFVQLSGLGVETDVQTAYFKAKRSAEQIVRESTVDSVLYRPSVVFGDGCAFLPFLERLTAARLVPLPGGGKMTIQPIWVEDLTPMLADGIEGNRHVGACYQLGGPEVLTLAETISLVRPGAIVIPVPTPLASIAFALADSIPFVPVGRDQFRALQLDNTVEANDVTEFGVAASELRSLRDYLR